MSSHELKYIRPNYHWIDTLHTNVTDGYILAVATDTQVFIQLKVTVLNNNDIKALTLFWCNYSAGIKILGSIPFNNNVNAVDALILAIPGNITLDKVDFGFQDEARIGQQNTTTRLWATKGSRPRSVKQQQFDYAYIFRALCSTTGESEALIAPHVDKALMTRYLEQISAKTEVGRYAVVIMDGAGWHQASLVEGININLLINSGGISHTSWATILSDMIR